LCESDFDDTWTIAFRDAHGDDWELDLLEGMGLPSSAAAKPDGDCRS
jgi:hypothetical protein